MIRSALCALALVGVGGPVLAGEESPVRTAELSARLFAIGQAAGDPLLMLSAARLRKQAGLAGGAGVPVGWEEMLAGAEAMAGGDAGMAAMIGDVRAEGVKGVISGPVYAIADVQAGGTGMHPEIRFGGGDYAEAYVEARQDADLNLTVTDAAGRLICADADPSPIAYCGWRPAETGLFTIRVENSALGTRVMR